MKSEKRTNYIAHAAYVMAAIMLLASVAVLSTTGLDAEHESGECSEYIFGTPTTRSNMHDGLDMAYYYNSEDNTGTYEFHFHEGTDVDWDPEDGPKSTETDRHGYTDIQVLVKVFDGDNNLVLKVLPVYPKIQGGKDFASIIIEGGDVLPTNIEAQGETTTNNTTFTAFAYHYPSGKLIGSCYRGAVYTISYDYDGATYQDSDEGHPEVPTYTTETTIALPNEFNISDSQSGVRQFVGWYDVDVDDKDKEVLTALDTTGLGRDVNLKALFRPAYDLTFAEPSSSDKWTVTIKDASGETVEGNTVKVLGPTPKFGGGDMGDGYTVDVTGNRIEVKDYAGSIVYTIEASSASDTQVFRGWSHEDSVIEDISNYPIRSAVKPTYVDTYTATVTYYVNEGGRPVVKIEEVPFNDDSVFTLSGDTLKIEIVNADGSKTTKTITTVVPAGKELFWKMYNEKLSDGTLPVRPGDVDISVGFSSKSTFTLTITEPKAGGTISGILEYEAAVGNEFHLYASGLTLHILDRYDTELGTVVATPSSGYTFAGWRLNTTSYISSDPENPAVVNSDSDVSALFQSSGGGGGGGGSDPEPIIEDETYTNPDGSVTKEHKVTQRHNDGSTDIDDTKDTEFTDGGTAHENEKTRIEKDGSGHSLYEATVKDKDGNTTDHTIVERRWTSEGTIKLRTVDDDFESGKLTSSTEVTMETNPLDGSTTITTSIDRYGEDGSVIETNEAVMEIKATVPAPSIRNQATTTIGTIGSVRIRPVRSR